MPSARNAAAVAAADGLDARATTSSSGLNWFGVLVVLVILGLGVLGLLLWSRRRTRKRREADLAAAQRIDPTDPSALAAVPLETLDELSRSIVVEVDNAVRTSDNELTLAVEEFGEQRTAPFSAAVTAARTALTQAFNARQILDDTVPETPAQRRDLLTRVIVAAAKADGHIDARERELIEGEFKRIDEGADVQRWLHVELEKPLDPAEIASAASTPEIASEMYLASVLVADETNFMERSYLDELARQLKLAPELKTRLEHEVKTAGDTR